jgi:hypothetical protein
MHRESGDEALARDAIHEPAGVKGRLIETTRLNIAAGGIHCVHIAVEVDAEDNRIIPADFLSAPVIPSRKKQDFPGANWFVNVTLAIGFSGSGFCHQ